MERPHGLLQAGRDRSDVVVAVGLWAATQIEVWGFWIEEEQGPKLLAAAMATGLGIALVWRRRHPLAVVAAIAALYAAWVVIDVPAGSLFPFLILLVAVYT